MNAPELLGEARRAGITFMLPTPEKLVARGDKLQIEHLQPALAEHKIRILDALRQEDAEVATHWVLHNAQGEPLEVLCQPPASRLEVLSTHAGFLSAEIFTQKLTLPPLALRADEILALRRWLAQIGESDPVLVEEVIRQCQTSQAAREGFLTQCARHTPG